MKPEIPESYQPGLALPAMKFASWSRTLASVNLRPENLFEPARHAARFGCSRLNLGLQRNEKRRGGLSEERRGRFDLLTRKPGNEQHQKVGADSRVVNERQHCRQIGRARSGTEAGMGMPFSQVIESTVIIARSGEKGIELSLVILRIAHEACFR